MLIDEVLITNVYKAIVCIKASCYNPLKYNGGPDFEGRPRSQLSPKIRPLSIKILGKQKKMGVGK
jgi:hypothetical protein